MRWQCDGMVTLDDIEKNRQWDEDTPLFCDRCWEVCYTRRDSMFRRIKQELIDPYSGSRRVG